MRVTFVTGNVKKFEEMAAMLENVELIQGRLDLIEIQGTRSEVAVSKCRQAVEHFKGPVITEDTSLGFSALEGLPGPYIKWFLEAVGHEGLNSMLSGFKDKSATAYCTLCFFDRSRMPEPVIMEGSTRGRVVPPRGPKEFGWDPVFEPEHASGLTYAEMAKEAKNAISHRGKAVRLLQRYLDEAIRGMPN